MADSKLRQAEQKNEVVGYLKEMNLELQKDADRYANGVKVGKEERIRGDIVIKAGDKDIKINFSQWKKKNDGGENALFKGYQTVMNEYVSMADVLESYKDVDLPDNWMSEVTRVSVNPDFVPNEYVNKSGVLVEGYNLKGTFINRTKAGVPDKATWMVEGFFAKKRAEMVDDEETGRVFFNVIIPVYGGKVLPLEIVADGDNAEYLDNNYELQQTGKIWGDFDFIETVEEKVTKAGFGKDKVETIKRFKKELLITGGEESQYDEDDSKSFNREIIKTAMNERQIELDKKLEEKKNEGGQKKGFTKPSASTKKAKSDDIPF